MSFYAGWDLELEALEGFSNVAAEVGNLNYLCLIDWTKDMILVLHIEEEQRAASRRHD